MTQTATLEVQAAFYAKIYPGGVFDAQLASYGFTGAFDLRSVAEGQAFDYITLGDSIEQPQNTMGKRGYLLAFTLHLWSRQLADLPSQQAVSRLNQLFDQQPLSLATQKHVSTMFDHLQTTPDPDGLTLHTTLRYMIYTEEF